MERALCSGRSAKGIAGFGVFAVALAVACLPRLVTGGDVAGRLAR